MRKLTTLLFFLLAASFTFAQTQMPASKEGRKRSTNGNASRLVTGAMLSTNFYVPGTTMDLTFTLELTNTDGEYGDSLAMVFPGPFSINGSADDPFPSPITGGQAPEALNGVTGQFITWGDDDNTYGGIEPGSVIPFAVNVTVAANATGNQTLGFYVSGDEFGGTPGPLIGTVTLLPAPNNGVPVLSGDLFETFAEIGSPVNSNAFTLANIGGAALVIDSTRLTGSEFSTNFNATSVPSSGSTIFDFTYSPTDLVDDADSFFIYTDQGRLAIALNGWGYGNGLSLEGFETGVFPPCQYQNQDVDGDGASWFPYGFVPHTGLISAASASWNGAPLSPDNYFILPKVTPDSTVAGKGWLRYFVAAQDASYPAENYSVVISTTDSSIASFTTTAFTEVLSSTDWKQIEVDLKQYHGQDIWVAFRHHNVSDQFLFKIDDIRVAFTNPNPVLTPITSMITVVNEGCEGDGLGAISVSPTGGSGLYGYIWNTGGIGSDQDSLAGGNYTVIVFDNCGTTPDTQMVTVGADNPIDDASFSYSELTYCNSGGNPVPAVTGLSGGSFFSPVGLAVDATTGEIDVAASTIGGPFFVIYSTNGPCPNSDTTSVGIDDCTGIEDLQSQQLEVYPNPNQGQFVLHNQGQARQVSLEVLDIQGRSVYAESLNLGYGAKHDISLNDVTPGVYLLKVVSDDQVAIERMIVR